MNRINNILTKIFLLLILAVGWGGTAWAQETKTITLSFSNITTTTATVNVSGTGADGVSATVGRARQNGTEDKNFFARGDGYNNNILGVEYRNSKNDYWELPITINGLSSANAYTLTTNMRLLNSSGNYQSNNTDRTWIETIFVNGNQHATTGDVHFIRGNANESRTFDPFTGSSSLVLTIKMQRTDALGCFSGIESINLTYTETINKGYRIIINGDNDYTVTTTADVNSGDKTAKDGGYLDLTNPVEANDLTSLSIDAPTSKLVWGPIIDKKNKTITFEISNPVDPQAGKWYKVQVLPTSGNVTTASTPNVVNTINEKIKPAGVKSDYIYMQNAAVPSNSSSYIHNFMGMTEKEAAGYIYVTSYSDNKIMINHINGRYLSNTAQQQNTVNNNSDIQITKVTDGDYSGSYKWDKWQPWVLNAADIAPYIGRAGSSTQNFQSYFAEVNPTEKFDVYKVNITGADANSTVTCSVSYNKGVSQVYNGGFLFFEKGVTPTWKMFTSNKFNGVDINISDADANNIRTITFTGNPEHDLNVIQFSDEPSNTEWAENTTWFTWKSNRGQDYLSTSANYVEDNFNLKINNTTAPDDRGGLWAFVGNNQDGFKIYNNAYGPKFVLAYIPNNQYRMVHVDEIPSNAVTTFTYNDQATNQRLPGISKAYVFRIGTTGNNQIHRNNSAQLISWDGGGSLRYDDQGSCFTINLVADVDVLPEFDVYHIATEGLTYSGDRSIFGKRNTAPYIIISKPGDEITKETLDPTILIQSVAIENPANTYIKELVVVTNNEYSPAPYDGSWAPGTKWFTWRSNRSNQGNSSGVNYNFRYVTVNGQATNDSYNLALVSAEVPTERGAYWCFVGDNTNGFEIYNAAYGTDFIFAYVNGAYKMVHKSEIPAGATTRFTHDESSVKSDGGTKGYTFRLGTTGVNHIHHSLGVLSAWNNGSDGHPRKDDTGSSWMLTPIETSTVEALAEFVAYQVRIQPEGLSISLPVTFEYTPNSDLGSKLSNHSSNNFILIREGVTPTITNFSSSLVPDNFTSFAITQSSTNPQYKIITLKGNVILPHVVHRPNGNLWRAQRNNYDGTETNTIGTQTAEYTDVTLKNGDVVKLQHTGVFEITHFLKPGESRQIWMPSTSSSASDKEAKILNYMRWFDYQNETLPDLNIVDFTADQHGDILGNAQYYQNGFVCGSSITGAYPSRYVLFNMPSDLDKSNVTYEYTLANEATRYTDYSNNFADGTTPSGGASYLGNFDDPNHKAQGNKNLVEPTIGTRQIYHIRSAHEMASKLSQCTGTKWLEEETITFPTRGVNWNNYEDVIPLEYNFLDYWAYNASDQLVNVRDGNTTIKCEFTENTLGLSVITRNATGFMAGCVGTFVEANGDASREAGHYVSFDYPADGIVRIPEGKTQATATYCVYLDVNGVRYNIKKFTLVFQNNVEPVPYYEVLENDEHARSDKSLAAQYGTTENPTGVYTQLNFHYPKNYLMGAPNAALQEGSGYYAFPYNFDEVSYSYYAAGMDWSDWGEYGMRNNAQTATRHSSLGANPYFLSVNYLRELYKKKNAEKELRDARDQLARAQDPLANFTEEEREMAQAEAQYHINRAQNTIAKQTRAVLDEAYHNNYYIYADASEQPGQVGRLRINEPLCTGTRIYGTAWLSCATAYTAGSPNPASVIFRFKGVRKDGTMTTIYSYCPGQISNIGRDKNRNEVYAHDELRSDSTAYKQAIWQQCAFSFVNTYPANEFDSFVLEVFNNCRGSSGGDIFLDDIRLYIKTPQVTVDNSAPICGEELSIVRISTDFDALMDALQGSEDSERKTYYGTYAILDKDVYDNYLAKKENPTSDDVSVAFNLALMGNKKKSDCYIGEDFHSELYAFHEIQFYNELTAHQHVTYAMLVGDNILSTAGYMYQYSAAGEIISRNLVFNCKLIDQRLAGKKYYIVFQVNEVYTDMEGIPEADYHEFFSMADICCAKSEFSTMRAKMVNIEGNEGLDPYNIDYCPGTAPTISLNSYGYDTEGNLIQEHGVYYDWYFGTKEQFKHEYVWLDNTEIDVDNLANYTQSEIITAEDFCMEHCLMNFRHFYPNAGVKELYDSTIVRVHHFEKDPVTEAEYELTAKMIAKLKEWVEVGKLRLHLTAVSVDLSASKGEELTHVLAIQQGAKLRYDPADVSKDNPIIYCMDPVEISFYTNLESPAATVGLNGVDYSITPYDNVLGSQDVFYSIPLRINKTQIKDIAQNESTTLQVPLRVITPSGYYKVDDGEGLVNCDNIHLEVDPMDNFVYVVETNDPQWEMHDINGDGVQYLPYVGRLISIDANKKRAEGVNTLKIVFNDESINMDRKFVPREGYYYILRTQFNEELNPGVELAPEYEVPDIKCKGNILIPLKVVPEYVKWTGRESNEWNNDRNWIRADYHELVPSKLQNPNNEYADYYVNFSDSVMADSDAVYNGLPLSANDEKEAADFDIYIPMDQPSASDLYNTFAYAPMAQTSVIIPTGAVRYPSLTTHQRSTQAGKIGLLDIDHSAEVSTPWIEYDMVAVPNATGYTADAYYENTIKDITFAPATQMGNAHMLSYKKAWVEYELNAERWYTLGSPLKNSFSGDWYAPTNGSKQLSPLFRDIKYVQGVNDRFRPAFFQRSWDLKGSNIVYLKAGGTQESYVKAEWSNVYNDAKVPYTEGGFSVKPELGYITPITLRPADGKVLVRMPKADQSYTYYDINGQTGAAADAQIGTRTNRLQTDDLGANGAGAINMTITNQTAGNEYFLVSNPFMSPMDMTAFFAANSATLEAKYWIVDNDRQMVSIKDAATDEWITTSSTDGQYVAPLQGFFVKSTAGSKTLSVTYTAAMQGLQASAPLLRSKAFADNGIETIEIVAERDGKESKAVVAIAEGADNGFVSEEDCETFLDGNLADQPAVYTSADGQALTINVVEELSLIPLGVISSDSSDVSISIKSTMAQPLYLYDKQTATVSPIASSTKLTIRANNAGRYFISTSEIIPADDELPTTTSARGVWTVGGVYCGETIQGVAPGVYVVDGVKTVVR